jgi:hypothetical protein
MYHRAEFERVSPECGDCAEGYYVASGSAGERVYRAARADDHAARKDLCRRRVEALLSGVWVQENRLVSARVISRFGTNQVSAVSAAQAEGNSHLPRVFAQITSPMIIASPATNRYTAMVRFSGEMLKGSPRVIETTPFVAAQ